MTLKAIKWENGRLEILDQLLLPAQAKAYIEITGVEDGWNAIYKMQVRCVWIFFSLLALEVRKWVAGLEVM